MSIHDNSLVREMRLDERRPPIVLTEADHEMLSALLNEGAVTSPHTSAAFLREEVERADVVADAVPPRSLVRMGSDVKYIDHQNGRAHLAKVVYPGEVHGPKHISILSSLGSALIGLGPGQSIRWTELGHERSLTVLTVATTALRSNLACSGGEGGDRVSVSS